MNTAISSFSPTIKLFVAALVVAGFVFSCAQEVKHSSGGSIKHKSGGYVKGSLKNKK